MKSIKKLMFLILLVITVSCKGQLLPGIGQFICPREVTTVSNNDGKYMVATSSSMLYSSNSGSSFSSIATPVSLSRYFVSNNGNLIMGASGSAGASGTFIYKSTNAGVNWSFKQIDATPNYYSPFHMNASYDGKYVIITSQTAWSPYTGYLYYSSDYGETWTANSKGKLYYMYVHVSETGQYMTVTLWQTNKVLFSSDYGVTFNYLTSMTSRLWTTCAISGTGQYLYATQYNTTLIATSSDYGASWTEKTAPLTQGYCYADMSYDGKYQYSIRNASPYTLVKSSDYGSTFSTAGSVSTIPYDLRCSADGKYILVTSTAATYLSSDYGVTFNTASTVASSGHNFIGKQKP